MEEIPNNHLTSMKPVVNNRIFTTNYIFLHWLHSRNFWLPAINTVIPLSVSTVFLEKVHKNTVLSVIHGPRASDLIGSDLPKNIPKNMGFMPIPRDVQSSYSPMSFRDVLHHRNETHFGFMVHHSQKVSQDPWGI